MKKFLVIAALLMVGVGGVLAAEYTAPTAAQVQGVLADPGSLGSLLAGASAEQAAAVLLQAITAADASALTEDQKKQAIAMLVARGVIAMGRKGNDTVAALAASVGDKWYSTVVASAFSVSLNVQATLAKILAAVGADTVKGRAAIAAAADPQGVLGIQLYAAVHGLGAPAVAGGGARAPGGQTGRPVATSGGDAERPPTPPPPTPPPYRGQSGR